MHFFFTNESDVIAIDTIFKQRICQNIISVGNYGLIFKTTNTEQPYPFIKILIFSQQMPGLQSFCVCTAIALASIYLLQLSWFTAWLALDERRKETRRDGLIPCLVHQEDWRPLGCSLTSSRLEGVGARLYERITQH